MNYRKELTFAKQVARAAGKLVLRGMKQGMKIKAKQGVFDIVTQYDSKTEKYIVGKIKKRFPGIGIYGEEDGRVGSKDTYWLIDPIDGTLPYSKGLPVFVVMMALVVKEEVVVGVIYDPSRRELFYAVRGEGAFLNGKRISVNSGTRLTYSLGSGYFDFIVNTTSKRRDISKMLAELGVLFFWYGGYGQAALACGRTDFYMNRGGGPWDFAPGALILKEAGAKVTDFLGKPYSVDSDELLAANPHVHKALLREIKKYKLHTR
ncbi:MAG TPA: inositol monophosphatase family protein [Patescibacteria group bacterium]|nr:inositol monophosphatase family protein [Patescibacteria group bacterium]